MNSIILIIYVLNSILPIAGVIPAIAGAIPAIAGTIPAIAGKRSKLKILDYKGIK